METWLNPWRTIYTVQAFNMNEGQLTPGKLRSADSGTGALRLGERLAAGSAGVVVFARRWADDLGEYDLPEILATHGKVPPNLFDETEE